MVQKPGLDVLKCATTLSGADFRTIRTLGKVSVELSMRVGKIEKSAKLEFIVVKDLIAEVILGVDILTLLKVEMNLATKSICFEDCFDESNTKNDNTVVKLAEETVLEPRSLTFVKADIDGDGLMLVKPHNISPTLIGANLVTQPENGRISVLLANIDVFPVRLERKIILASFELMSETNVNDKVEANSVKITPIRSLSNTQETVNVGPNLSDLQLAELDKLLELHLEAFSIDGQIGTTDIISHKIELIESARPFKEPHRRRPKLHVDEAKRQIELMLKVGVIEESNSPFASAYLLVEKKNGDMRMCIDFRRLNAMTKKSSYPLPNIEEYRELGRKKIFQQS